MRSWVRMCTSAGMPGTSLRFSSLASSLSGISMRAFQFVQLPRVLDHPDRRLKEKDPGRQLRMLARRFRQALQAWKDSIKDLTPRVDYTPPPSDHDVSR